jgi:hypothetical protein
MVMTYILYHQMLYVHVLDTRNKNTYGLGVEFLIFLRYKDTSYLKGAGPPYTAMTYMSSDGT